MRDGTEIEFMDALSLVLETCGVFGLVHQAKRLMDEQNIPKHDRYVEFPGIVVVYPGKECLLPPMRVNVGRIMDFAILVKVEFRNEKGTPAIVLSSA